MLEAACGRRPFPRTCSSTSRILQIQPRPSEERREVREEEREPDRRSVSLGEDDFRHRSRTEQMRPQQFLIRDHLVFELFVLSPRMNIKIVATSSAVAARSVRVGLAARHCPHKFTGGRRARTDGLRVIGCWVADCRLRLGLLLVRVGDLSVAVPARLAQEPLSQELPRLGARETNSLEKRGHGMPGRHCAVAWA